MPGAARLNDIGSGHDCFPDTPVTEGSTDVLINGLPAARVGDTVKMHGCPCPQGPHGVHGRKIASGSSTVSINGKSAARIGDDIDCGGLLVSGSSNVIIGDIPYKSPVQHCVEAAVKRRDPLISFSDIVENIAPPRWSR